MSREHSGLSGAGPTLLVVNRIEERENGKAIRRLHTSPWGRCKKACELGEGQEEN